MSKWRQAYTKLTKMHKDGSPIDAIKKNRSLNHFFLAQLHSTNATCDPQKVNFPSEPKKKSILPLQIPSGHTERDQLICVAQINRCVVRGVEPPPGGLVVYAMRRVLLA